jgi:hypothetical protein
VASIPVSSIDVEPLEIKKKKVNAANTKNFVLLNKT